MDYKDFVLKAIQLYKGKVENKIVRSLFTAGTVCIIAAVSPNYLIPFIIELSNQYLHTQLDAPDMSVNYIYTGTLIGIGLILYVMAFVFYFKVNKKEIIGTLLQIRHSSIESSNTSQTSKDYSNYKTEVIDIEQSIEMSHSSEQGIRQALYIQEKAVNKIIQYTNGNASIDVMYYGLAHIPLVTLLGYQISDKIPVQFNEWNQNKGQWELVSSNTKSYPPLLLERYVQKQKVEEVTEVVVKIGLTYLIPDENLQGLNLQHLNYYYLHLEKPHRNNIVNTRQLQRYKQDFRDLLDEINQTYFKLEKIHLFYSGQTSFAYYIGSAITPRMDKEVIIYNYVGNEFPQYNWYLNLKKSGQPITVSLTKEYVDGNV